MNPAQVTKTGIIVGMGEETHELLAVFEDLAARKVDILTIGQYLRPPATTSSCPASTPPRSSPSSSTKPCAWASATSNPAPSSVRATTPTSKPSPPASPDARLRHWLDEQRCAGEPRI